MKTKQKQCEKRGVYDFFKSIAAAKRYYKRCRSMKTFILDEQAANKLTCSVCGKKIGEHNEPEGYRSNFGHYHPKTKKVSVAQYVCAWSSLLGKIHAMY